MTHLVLAGASGSEQQAVARLLADRLQCPLVDCGTEVEALAGRPISAIVAEDGENAVHALEMRALTSILRQSEASVLLLERGMLEVPEHRELLGRTGPIIILESDLAAVGRHEPVPAGLRTLTKVAEPLAKIRDLLESREPASVSADLRLNVSTREPETVVEEILDWLHRIHVNLGPNSYDIHLDEGCHRQLGQRLASWLTPVSSVVILSSREIDRRYGDTVRAGLDEAGIPHHTLLIPAGERYKSLQTAGRLYGDLIQRKVDRRAVIVAMGGGVIGDLAGFVAATYERGVRFVQVPTTLLAQVDSSVGGKVGVNHALGKNMIGAFLQPKIVLIDPGALRSLPLREVRSGLAEVVKYGVIWDDEFFAYLESHVEGILRLDPQSITHVIRRSCQIKARVVEEDETEADLRAILNFGHTTAHAVETYTSYERYTHGEAVAIGMVVASRIAHAMGMMRAEPVHRLTRLLERFELPTHLPKADPGVLMSLMDTDKKAVAGKVRFVLPTKIGHVELVNEVSRDILRRAIKESLEM